MTREELKVHCEKQIKECEMWAKHNGEEPSGKIYEEHKLILELLEQEPFKPMVEIDPYSVIKQKYIERGVLDKIRAELEQEPFKPMVEIDLYSVIKQKYIERGVLDKIRAELEEHAKINQNLNTDRAKAICWCLDVIDKYVAETEDQNGSKDEG